MNRQRLIAVLCGALCVLACGCETKAYKELHQEKIALEIEHQRVLEQMNEIWTQSLKSRLPLVRPIDADKPMEVGLRYIKSLTLSPKEHYNDQWKASVTYVAKADETQPDYVLYLFDERGLNIAATHVTAKSGVLSKLKLKKGETKTQPIKTIQLMLSDTPRFYWIRFLR